MFNNPDFKGWPNALMFLAMFNLYDLVYAYAHILGITWVDISSATKGPYNLSRSDLAEMSIFFFCICCGGALFTSFRRCLKRIKSKEVSWAQAGKEHLRTLAEFGGVLILFIIFFPIIVPYMRGWR